MVTPIEAKQPVRSLKHLRRLVAVVMLSHLIGCAADRIHRQASELMRQGDYEQAMTLLDTGTANHPGSAQLRSLRLQSRNDAFDSLVSAARRARGQGQLDEAERLLGRARSFDSGSNRVEPLLAELALERRQREALNRAIAMADTAPAAALLIAQAALRENPRHPELLSLKRRIEIQIRDAQLQSQRATLSEGRPISLDFRGTNLRTVLEAVTRNSGINFVLDKDVPNDIRVTIYLKSTLVDNALDVITSTHGLSRKLLDDRTVLIYPNTPEKQREHQEQVVKTFHLASTDARSAAAYLKSMLKIREPFVDERTNMLALRESPENIALAERLIAIMDVPEAEVMLELEVIEVRATRLLDLGVKPPESISLTPFGPDGSTGGITLGNLGSLTRNNIGVSIPGTQINLRRDVGDYNTLAHPSIRTRNKEKAKILVGDKVPVVTTTVGQGGFMSDNVTYLDVGLKLEIQPTIFADNEVAMNVALEVSSVAREVRTGTGGLAYQIGTRNASTSLRLRDGETQILAGLLSHEERSSASGIPGLGDLPIAGRLFASKRDEGSKTELMLAITPRIIRNPGMAGSADAEIWVGTETNTRLRQVVGGVPLRLPDPSPKDTKPASQLQKDSRVEAAGGTAAPSAAPTQPDATGPSATVALVGPAKTSAGEPIEVVVRAASSTPLRGLALSIGFDRDVLQLMNVEERGLFRQGQGRTRFSHHVNEPIGNVQIGLMTEAAQGVSGDGDVVALKFLAKRPGTSQISLIGADPIRDDGTAPGTVDRRSLSVTVVPGS